MPAAETFTLFEAPKVHVFSLPPTDFLKSDNWEGNYIWSGSLKFIREGNFFAVRLVEKDTNELFGECPVRENTKNTEGGESVQPATDSTRAFVLRVEEGDQFSYVGLLFDDRTIAYNFSSALIHRRKGLGPAPVLPVHDHSLGKDESITVDLFNKVKTGQKDIESMSGAAASSTTVVGNSHFGGEIPRVDLFSLEIKTSGKSRRVKVHSNEILQQQAAAVGAASSENNNNNNNTTATSSLSSSSKQQQQASPIDDIFGSSSSSSSSKQTSAAAAVPLPSQQQQQQQKAKPAADLDDVFSSSNTATTANNSNNKQKDVLDALFG